MTLSPDLVAGFIRDTAQSIILPRFQALARHEIREKAPGDFVTIADEESERELTRLLSNAMPGSVVLGEEAVAADSGRMALLAGDDPVWVIDPVDGTGNFARGVPGFAVIVALVERGMTTAGWIYDPLRDVMIIAERGEGAWSEGRRLAVTDVPPDLMVGAAYGKFGSPGRAQKILADSGRIAAVRNRGSSGLEYMVVALGEAQFSLHSRSLPWDHAAGMLIVTEAGGAAAFLDGSPYDPRIPDRPVLATSSVRAWHTVHDVVIPPG